MHTVVETPSFIAAAKSVGMTNPVRADVVNAIAENPMIGEVMEGTGGFRKFRFARPGGGKSGGFRVVSYFHSAGMPAFLITVFGKSQKANLSKQERNELAKLSAILIATYAARLGKKDETR